MPQKLTLVVLRCADLPSSRECYDALGLELRRERHGSGPERWSCVIGGTVLELYPAEHHEPSQIRLGFRVDDVTATVRAFAHAGGTVVRDFDASSGTAVVQDPDGAKIELSGPPAAATHAAVPRWTVWRQDDNGNQFAISRGLSRDDADRVCSEFEQRGHKQTYWITPDDETAS